MSRKPSHLLQAVWDAVPDSGCRGFCAESCGPIGCGPAETRLLAERGVTLPDLSAVLVAISDGAEPPTCPALVDGRCSVYDLRPTICRMWGSIDAMPCPWGCAPTGGRLDRETALVLMRAATAAP